MTNRVESGCESQFKDRLGVGTLVAMMIKFEIDCIEEYDALVGHLDKCKYWI